MQYFENEKIIPSHGTNYAKRRNKSYQATIAALESMEFDRELDNISNNKMQNSLNEDFMNLTKIEIKKDNKERNRQVKLQEELNAHKEQICKDIFLYTVYESLLLDESVKSDNFNYIKDNVYSFFETLTNNNFFKIEDNSIFKDIYNTSKEITEKRFINNESMDYGEILQETLEKEDLNIKFLESTIKAKLAECYRMEKKIGIKKNQFINEGVDFDQNKTLFRKIFEKNIKKTINESENTDPNFIQDMALMESLLDYCILESANTLEICNIDMRKFRTEVKYF